MIVVISIIVLLTIIFILLITPNQYNKINNLIKNEKKIHKKLDKEIKIINKKTKKIKPEKKRKISFTLILLKVILCYLYKLSLVIITILITIIFFYLIINLVNDDGDIINIAKFVICFFSYIILYVYILVSLVCIFIDGFKFWLELFFLDWMKLLIYNIKENIKKKYREYN